MNPSALSSACRVRRLTPADVPEILALSVGNPLFYQYCPPFVTEKSILADMEALPPGVSPADKYYVGFFQGDTLTAVLDLILGYPDGNTAFIGLFMTRQESQGKGVGSALTADVVRCLQAQGFGRVRLAYAKGNPQSAAFWHKNGFRETGQEADNGSYTAVVMERSLSPDGTGAAHWVGAWSTSPVRFDLRALLNRTDRQKRFGPRNLTFRTRLQPTIFGRQLRVTLSNTFGTGPVTLDAMTVAKGDPRHPGACESGTLHPILFCGASSVTLAPGQIVTSDPVPMAVEALGYLTFSAFFKRASGIKTYGMIGGATCVSVGNHTTSVRMSGLPLRLEREFGEYDVIPLLLCVEVDHPGGQATVLLGDSTIANDAPLLLARRLHDHGITHVGILQQAIKGNRLMADGAGPLGMIYGESVLHRFERDGLNQPGVDTILLKAGANDLIHPNCASMKGVAPLYSAAEMIDGYKALIAAAHSRGIRLYLCTRTAWKGYSRKLLKGDVDIVWTEELDQPRKELNAWIRSGDNPADGVIDLDGLCRDEAATELQSGYTTDGAHLTAAGQQALVDRIPLDIWQQGQ